jgi:hypothetical protein
MGLIAFVIGAVILLQKFSIIPEDTWGYLWPAILIVIGLKLMISCCPCHGGSCSKDACPPAAKPKKGPAKKPAKKAKKKAKK